MKILFNKIRNLIFYLLGEIKRRSLSSKWIKRNKNKNFSIICNSCVGGVIYHDLGLEFLSPTINMYLNPLDLIRFASNLKYYCSLDLQFIETDEPHPVAMLDDITLYFNHSKTEDDAERDWNRRKKRINYENLYLILFYWDGYTIEQIREIEKVPCKKAVVLTYKPLGLDYEVYMVGNGDPKKTF